MGALHQGHLSLVRRSRKENDLTVLSIFVNPAQFSPTEDLAKYPRNFKQDLLLAKREKTDIIFYPSIKEIYPKGCLTYIHVEEIADGLCGKFRPGHFRGVATIVGKLLNIVQPDTMYLGQKDAQQVVVLKKMAADINFPVTIKVCPTIREKDGLALSSRNSYLTQEQRKEAPVLFESLNQAKEKIRAGERKTQELIGLIEKNIQQKSSGRIEYIACADAKTLKHLEKLKGEVLIALAVWFGSTRLIDNITVRIP